MSAQYCFSYSYAGFFGDEVADDSIDDSIDDTLKQNLTLLTINGIKSKLEFKAWCRRNHPDKTTTPPANFHEVLAAGMYVNDLNAWLKQ